MMSGNRSFPILPRCEDIQQHGARLTSVVEITGFNGSGTEAKLERAQSCPPSGRVVVLLADPVHPGDSVALLRIAGPTV